MLRIAESTDPRTQVTDGFLVGEQITAQEMVHKANATYKGRGSRL